MKTSQTKQVANEDSKFLPGCSKLNQILSDSITLITHDNIFSMYPMFSHILKAALNKETKYFSPCLSTSSKKSMIF